MPRPNVALPLLAAAAVLAGCGADADGVFVSRASLSEVSDAPAAARVLTLQMPIVEGGDATPTDAGRPEGVKPKIIYTATLRIVTENLSDAEAALPGLVERFGGYVARADVDRSSGRFPRGSWTVRVPVANYDAFLAGADGLGVVEEKDETATDVTAEFVDVEARLASRRKLETRLLELLEDRAAELKDVLETERELARVREEIETAEGRLRYLSNQTAFSTVTLNVRQEREYVPPAEPTFGGKIAATWDRSLTNLAAFARGLVLFAVAAAPFVVVFLLPPAALVWVLIRRRRARRS